MKSNWLLVIMFFLTLSVTAQENLSQPIDKQFLIGNFDYRTSALFVQVSREHSARPIYLQRTVYEAFIRMFEQAKKEGVNLKIVSGTRNFNEQKVIWEKKWKGLLSTNIVDRPRKILEYSSMPATSRHHWGTDLDLNNLENSYFESGNGKAVYEWLVVNAHKYGFHQVYTAKTWGRTGYDEEKWHWSYMPLASLYLKSYNELITYTDITGFEGAHLAEQNRMISDYVNGITPQPSIVGNTTLEVRNTQIEFKSLN